VKFLSRASQAIARLASLFGAVLAKNIQFREVMLFAGALLIGIGLGQVWLPAALIVPGAMLAYVAIFGVK
jgi:hypothetical protein